MVRKQSRSCTRARANANAPRANAPLALGLLGLLGLGLPDAGGSTAGKLGDPAAVALGPKLHTAAHRHHFVHAQPLVRHLMHHPGDDGLKVLRECRVPEGEVQPKSRM